MLRRLHQFAIFALVSLALVIFYWRDPRHQLRISLAGTVDTSSLFLAEEQCAAAFPGLFDQVDNAEAGGRFDLKRLKDDTAGLVQGRIKDGKLYIISASPDNVLRRVPATLHALHRAIITSPSPLPDTIFALSINDIPRSNTWSFSRSEDDFTPDTKWLMPHYSSWSWPIPSLGPLDSALDRIEEVERGLIWGDKADKAIWRGTPWFNPDWRPGLRPMLIEVAGGREWADVEAWGQGQNNSLAAEDFCKYKYIVYAEGKTYSGRLPYHLGCKSIILTPAPTYALHTSHLLRPIFSSLLLSSSNHPSTPTSPPASSYPLPQTAITWPLSYPPSQANIIYVAPDWSDLEDTITYLRANPSIAEGIAGRQRSLWVGGDYLGEGAETCYWRRLVRGWTESVRVKEEDWEEGIRWETFVLLGGTKFE